MDSVWFSIFLAIAVAIIVVAAWMRWFAHRAIKEHRQQVEEILREMREEIDRAQAGGDEP